MDFVNKYQTMIMGLEVVVMLRCLSPTYFKPQHT